jgi:hypothetical protein
MKKYMASHKSKYQRKCANGLNADLSGVAAAKVDYWKISAIDSKSQSNSAIKQAVCPGLATRLSHKRTGELSFYRLGKLQVPATA